MPDADAPRRAGIPPRFARPLALAAKGELPPNVALMHILIEAADEAEARAILAAAAAEEHAPPRCCGSSMPTRRRSGP